MHLSTNTTWTSNFTKCIKQLHRPYDFFAHTFGVAFSFSFSIALFLHCSLSLLLSFSFVHSFFLTGPLSLPPCLTLALLLAHLICLICVRCAFVLNKNKCRLQGTDTAIRVHRIYQFVCIIVVAVYRKISRKIPINDNRSIKQV